MTGLVAWLAAALGWASMWLCGRRDRHGWMFSVAASVLWLGINARLGLWAGVAASAIAAVIAARNWQTWRSPRDADAER